MVAANEIGWDATIATVLSGLGDIFTIKEHKNVTEAFFWSDSAVFTPDRPWLELQ